MVPASFVQDFDESVTNPSHYDIQVRGASCEVSDIQKAFLAHWKGDLYAGHCLATALKYIFRAGRKNGVGDIVKDLGKASIYVMWALAASNLGQLPRDLLAALEPYRPLSQAKTEPADLFPPVEEEDGCKDGFCPMPIHSGDRGPRDEQAVHPAVRAGIQDVTHDAEGYHKKIRPRLSLDAELEAEILGRQW